ncbi:MAG: beta-lactamase family protein [Clostridia bacterium]|nr:beta-lactamase family protein [Clostridia bacterium]
MRILDPISLQQNIETRVAQDLREHNISGASVLVRQAGKTVYQKQFGTVSPERDVPVSEDTVFRLASMTKPIVAAATLTLVQKGQLSLDDPVARYLPEFADAYYLGEGQERIPLSEPITVKQILTHTSGIGSGTVWGQTVAAMEPENYADAERFARFLATQPLSYVPGTKQEYSGVGAFSVLTAVIQRITGCTLEDYLQQAILRPCRMTDTTFSPTEEQWARLVAMHDKVDGKSVVGKTYEGCVFEFFPPATYLGGAGLVSTVGDYARFTEMLLNRGMFEGKQILSPELVRQMTTPQVSEAVQPGKQRWGLSVRVITGGDYGRLPVGAFGWSGAFGTHFWVDPHNQIVAIYLKNSRYDGGSGAKTAANFERDVAASFLDKA